MLSTKNVFPSHIRSSRSCAYAHTFHLWRLCEAPIRIIPNGNDPRLQSPTIHHQSSSIILLLLLQSSQPSETILSAIFEPGYNSVVGSETMDTKQAVEQYKHAAEHALFGLNNTSEEDATVQPTATNNEGTQETHPDVNDDSFDSESN
jgi:hypothetical protein